MNITIAKSQASNNAQLSINKLINTEILSLVILVFFVICDLLFVISPSLAADQNISIAKGKVYLNLKDADIKSVLQTFAKATNVNIVAADDVTGKITVTFTGITPRDGLEAVLRTRGLDWFEDHGTIFVSTKKIMRSYYLANAKPSDLQTTLTSILPTGSIVTADDSYNVLVIQTSSDYLPRLEKLIQELDIPPVQVMVETKMIELQGTDGGTIGANLSYTKSNNSNNYAKTVGQSGLPTDSSAQGLYAHAMSIFSSASLEAMISAIATNQKLNVVAAPRLTTLNNKEATILIGQKLGYKTSIISQTSTTQVINFLEVGTALTLKPNVTKNGYIRMVVSPKISDGSVVNDLPNENTTETKNEVMVRDGQTFVIGGLTKDSETQTDYGVPFLMNIPILGQIFRRTVTSQIKTELLVFVTPHIITPEYLEVLNKPIEELQTRSDNEKARLIH